MHRSNNYIIRIKVLQLQIMETIILPSSLSSGPSLAIWGSLIVHHSYHCSRNYYITGIYDSELLAWARS